MMSESKHNERVAHAHYSMSMHMCILHMSVVGYWIIFVKYSDYVCCRLAAGIPSLSCRYAPLCCTYAAVELPGCNECTAYMHAVRGGSMGWLLGLHDTR